MLLSYWYDLRGGEHWEGKLVARAGVQERVRRLLTRPAVVEVHPRSGRVSRDRQSILFPFIHYMPLILTADAKYIS